MSTEDRQDNRQEPGRLVRPYAMTGGRTRPADDDLELETLVSTTSLGETSLTLSLERRSIALLCGDILSIAEISARLDRPSASSASSSATWPRRGWSPCTGPPALATAPTLRFREGALWTRTI